MALALSFLGRTKNVLRAASLIVFGVALPIASVFLVPMLAVSIQTPAVHDVSSAPPPTRTSPQACFGSEAGPLGFGTVVAVAWPVIVLGQVWRMSWVPLLTSGADARTSYQNLNVDGPSIPTRLMPVSSSGAPDVVAGTRRFTAHH